MKKKILPVLALLIVMLLCSAAPARAASGTITEYHQVAYGVMRVLDPHLAKGRWEHKIVSVSKPEEK